MTKAAKTRRVSTRKKTATRKYAEVMTAAVKKPMGALRAVTRQERKTTKRKPAASSTTPDNKVQKTKPGTKRQNYYSEEVLLARRQKADSFWEDRFTELLKFKKEHGHCLVPKVYKKNQPLAYFVQRNRMSFKAYKSGDESKLTAEKIQRLHDIEFCFHAKGTDVQTSVERQRNKQKIDEKFERLFKQLCDYKKEHGHCLVPKVCKENPKLAAWVRAQRSQYKKKSEGQIINLTDEQIKRLDGVGFCWNCKADDNWKEREYNRRYLKSIALWDERYERLLKFKAIHGHCVVPKVYKTDPLLSSWVFRQRRQYKLKQEGKQNSMKDDRLKKLVEIGFTFSIRGSAPAKIQTRGSEESSEKSCEESDHESISSEETSEKSDIESTCSEESSEKSDIESTRSEESYEKSDDELSVEMKSATGHGQTHGPQERDNEPPTSLSEEVLALQKSSRKPIKARKYAAKDVKQITREDYAKGDIGSDSSSGSGLESGSGSNMPVKGSKQKMVRKVARRNENIKKNRLREVESGSGSEADVPKTKTAKKVREKKPKDSTAKMHPPQKKVTKYGSGSGSGSEADVPQNKTAKKVGKKKPKDSPTKMPSPPKKVKSINSKVARKTSCEHKMQLSSKDESGSGSEADAQSKTAKKVGKKTPKNGPAKMPSPPKKVKPINSKVARKNSCEDDIKPDSKGTLQKKRTKKPTKAEEKKRESKSSSPKKGNPITSKETNKKISRKGYADPSTKNFDPDGNKSLKSEESGLKSPDGSLQKRKNNSTQKASPLKKKKRSRKNTHK